MASLENRGNGSWRVTVCGGYRPDGSKIRVRRTFNADPHSTENAQRKQAEKFAAALETDFARQQVTDAKKLTFKAVYEDYIQDRCIRRDLAQQTVDSYKKLFNQKLLPHFGKSPIRDITARDLNAFFRGLKKTVTNKETGKPEKVEISGTYARKYYQQLNELFRYAQRAGIIITNPCNLIDPPKIDTKEAEFYEKDEIPDILEAINKHPDPEWRCYFLMQFYCGSRPEEMTGLNWSDFDGKQISITAGAYQAKSEKCKRTDKPKTKKSNRKIDLPTDAIAAMNDWHTEQRKLRLKAGGSWPAEEAVFTNEYGERISIGTPSKKWRRFTADNGIRHLPLYDLRHTNCSLLISSRELSVEEVAARMGHEQTSTTLNIYTHCFSDSNERATSALLNVLESVQKKAE